MRRIEMELRALGITTLRVGGLAKRAASLGLPKMTRHTATSTEWMITAGVADELAAGTRAQVVLADCAPLAALAYYTAALEHRGEPVPVGTAQRVRALVTAFSTPYDLLFATVPDPREPPASMNTTRNSVGLSTPEPTSSSPNWAWAMCSSPTTTPRA